MSAEIVKTILYFLSGGFLIFLAITITRDSFSSRLNRVTGAMLGFAGLGPIFMALGTVIIKSATAPVDFEESTLYSFYHLWEFFFPFLLVFSWIYPIDRFRDFRHQRLLYIVFIPQVIHLIVVLFFGDLTQLLAALEIGPGEESMSALILRPLSRLLTWLLLLVSYVRTNHAAIFGIVNLLYVFTAIYFLESGRRYLSNPRLLSQTKLCCGEPQSAWDCSLSPGWDQPFSPIDSHRMLPTACLSPPCCAAPVSSYLPLSGISSWTCG